MVLVYDKGGPKTTIIETLTKKLKLAGIIANAKSN